MMVDKNKSDQDVEYLLQMEEIEEKQRQVLTRLLDSKIKQQGRYIAIRGHMGRIRMGPDEKSSAVPSFSVMHQLDWVAKKNVLMGAEMDFMRHMIDPETGRINVDEESAEEMKQRAPDWSRQAELTTYLIQEDLRKFGTILAVISPEWIDDPNHDNWGKDGRAIKSAADFEPLDSHGTIGLLNLSGCSVYALDGQHRVMGVRGVQELLEGGLSIKSSAGSVKKTIPKDEFLARVGKDASHVHYVLTEQISIEYIPAVLMGENREEASRRIRSVFVAINSYAKRTEKGENILLSENDGFSIVARRVAHHPIFKTSVNNSRVNWKSATLRDTESTQVTTLATLKNSVENFNDYVTEFSWEPLFKGVLPVRPLEHELKELAERFEEFLGYCNELPVFKRVAAGDDLASIRSFPSEANPSGEGHLLVRPIGLPILAKAVGQALESQSLEVSFKKLAKFDKASGFSVHRPESVFYGVTYDPGSNKMKAQVGSQSLAAGILRYLLIGGGAEQREELEKSIRRGRRVSETEWIGPNGEVQNLENDRFELPNPIQL